MNNSNLKALTSDRTSSLFFVLGLSLVAVTFFACNRNNPTGPALPQESGIKGRVYNTDGHLLDSTRIYCYFSYALAPSYTPVRASSARKKATLALSRIADVNSFSFQLYQNFPNPIYNDTYFRFALPKKCRVTLSIARVGGGQEVYSYADSLLAGMYQLYVPNLVDSLQLGNCPYDYRIAAIPDSGNPYSAMKQLFVISDLGKPACATDTSGTYAFQYGDAFVGDSVAVNPGEPYAQYNVVLERTVVLHFERRGYQSTSIGIRLIPNVMLVTDVIMFTGSSQ
ncbi:MAG: hypothetical protein ABSF91_12980 [Bacteroidota bacterium]|jgi:hypothetical protein